jgi:tetratricopeptide (TPR) repeat protein
MPGNPNHRTPLRVAAVAAASLAVACGPSEVLRSPVQITSAELPSGASSDPATALLRADRALAAAPDNAWGHYQRAIALQRLRHTDEAVTAYREAEARFGDARWAKSIAIYGRARTLDEAGRCHDARAAYDDFATLVESTDPNAAEMARSYAQLCRTKPTPAADPLTSEVATAVVARDYARALSLAERSSRSGDRGRLSPWLDYNRGVALAELRRTDEAVRAFRSAERGFGEGDNDDAGRRWGRSIAVYGRARALDAAGRCSDAKEAYRQYAAFVQDRQAADVALAVARRCEGP